MEDQDWLRRVHVEVGQQELVHGPAILTAFVRPPPPSNMFKGVICWSNDPSQSRDSCQVGIPNIAVNDSRQAVVVLAACSVLRSAQMPGSDSRDALTGAC
jgi:hypothetical protein